MEGHPKLTIRYGQAQFKIKNHGEVHDLPYRVKENGNRVTAKTEENIDRFIDSITNMPYRKNIQWFDNGTYQGNTDRGYKAVHIYDLDNRVIAVFKKSTGQFVTTCRLDPDEHTELLNTGN